MLCIILKKRVLLAIFACVLTIAAIPVAIHYANNTAETVETAASPNTNWGLSFPKEGGTPTGNASAEFLQQYDAFFVGKTAEKRLYLTFDAGYENGYTPQILDVLAAHNVKAAFFLVGNYLETAPDLVKRMVNEGHLVGNHTYHHPDMSKIGDIDAFERELQALEALFFEITGQEMERFYRPPQGKYSQSNLKQAQHLGYYTAFWSLAYVDWYTDNQPTKSEAFQKLLPRIHNGAVILLHSTSQTNAEMLDEFLTELENQGYSFGTLHEIVA